MEKSSKGRCYLGWRRSPFPFNIAWGQAKSGTGDCDEPGLKCFSIQNILCIKFKYLQN